MKISILKYITITALLLMMFDLALPENLFARGGSFGGSRGGGGRSFGRSFGGSRSSSSSRSSGGLFGSSPKSSPSKSSYSTPSRSTGSSFGGARKMTTASARAQYGTPRKVDNFQRREANGYSRNYQINDYGGYSSGLMRGYMMGQVTSYMMWAPWHGAYWYSRPTYVYNPDGTVGVYPPTFDYTKLFITLFIVGGIAFVVYVIVRNRKRNSESYSSFG